MGNVMIDEERLKELLLIEEMNKCNKSDHSILEELSEIYNDGLNRDPSGDDWNVWAPIYDKVFSKYLKLIKKNHTLFNFYDPDCRYYDDVSSLYYTFKEYVESL